MRPLALVVGLTAVVFVAVFVSSQRRLAEVDRDDPSFRRDWKGVERGRRRRIAQAVRRGEAVADPRDAELAVRLAARAHRGRQVFSTHARNRKRRIVGLALAMRGRRAVPLRRFDTASLVLVAALVLGEGSRLVADGLLERSQRRMTESARQNRELLEALRGNPRPGDDA